MLQNVCENWAEWSSAPFWDVLSLHKYHGVSCPLATNGPGCTSPIQQVLQTKLITAAGFESVPALSLLLSREFPNSPPLLPCHLRTVWNNFPGKELSMGTLQRLSVSSAILKICNIEPERQLDSSCVTQNCYFVFKTYSSNSFEHIINYCL